MKRATITERWNKRQTTGRLLYVHTYPHAVTENDDGRVERFERRVQSVGILTDSGETWHFTVPASVHEHQA